MTNHDPIKNLKIIPKLIAIIHAHPPLNHPQRSSSNSLIFSYGCGTYLSAIEKCKIIEKIF